ncbi:hypothetical protein O6H91_03G064300 [Diphasiastrum complanatum]|uniref:Uncharacterized protein n=1 Tax=Diphasiastrum complanatum TaxID=34168 RepID=A0ACC2E755_DIPCM|nr:hypothetical protein O6H91_03G064300 [Diphasiastrum complanatum]
MLHVFVSEHELVALLPLIACSSSLELKKKREHYIHNEYICVCELNLRTISHFHSLFEYEHHPYIFLVVRVYSLSIMLFGKIISWDHRELNLLTNSPRVGRSLSILVIL